MDEVHSDNYVQVPLAPVELILFADLQGVVIYPVSTFTVATLCQHTEHPMKCKIEV